MGNNILFHEEFVPRATGNTLMAVEVWFMDMEMGNTRFVAVDVSISSGIFGDLAVAEQYGNAILEAVRIAREKRNSLGLNDKGTPIMHTKTRNPDSPLSDVQMKALRDLSEDGTLLLRRHSREGGNRSRARAESVWVYQNGVEKRRVNVKTLDSLRKGKFVQRAKPPIPIERQGHTSFYKLSPLGAETLAEFWKEPA